MSSYDLAQVLFRELGYSDSPGFAYSAQSTDKAAMWRDVRHVPHVDGIYWIRNIPVAYFSHLDDGDPVRIRDLHRRVWNQSKVPLLYVVLPYEIRVYNGYAKPAELVEHLDSEGRLLQHLQQLTDVEKARQAIRRHLVEHCYDRLHLDTGAFWYTDDGRRVHRHDRADQRLLRDLSHLRDRLLQKELSNELAYALLGRSILVRYLEDRKILSREQLLELTDGRATSYYEALQNRDVAYALFERLSRRFNGDLFPVLSDEQKAVRQPHLDLVRGFLAGEDMETGQMSFWPYDFQYIPIELISGIYDTFLNTDERRKAGTFYTPLPLVDFILDETMPLETVHSDMTVLDPACGSGIFLVRAYQRLVNAWRRQCNQLPTVQQLMGILTQSVFGVDIKPEAIRIAAFNLYMALLDQLDTQAILDEHFRFPPLLGTNLISSDFFAPEVKDLLGGRKFDRIVGNPPWGRNTLTHLAEQAIKARALTIGEKQVVQAFLMCAPDFCANGGEIALLAPTRSTILVTSNTHETFRKQFFKNHRVRAVANFSALCYELFEDTLHPATALFYSPDEPVSTHKIAYGTPKPSPLSQQLGAIVLDATEVKYLDQEELMAFPWLWKVASWGNSRDAVLIKRLKALPLLRGEAERLGWKIAEGIQIEGGDENLAPWLQGMPLLPTDRLRRYALDAKACVPITTTVFHRPRTADITQGPLALIRHSPVQGRCAAAFWNGNVAYRHTVSGVIGKPGQENLLKWLVAYINSPLAQYYQFLTSTCWAVERATIVQEEYLRMPCPIPSNDDPILKQVVDHFDQIVSILKPGSLKSVPQSDIQFHETAMAKLIFDFCQLTLWERQLVHDTIGYGIDFFYWSKRKQRKPGEASAVMPPDAKMLREYAEAFVETATALLRYEGKTLDASVYRDGEPLSIVAFRLSAIDKPQGVQVIESSNALKETLKHLDRLLLDQRAPSVYTRRHVRVYDGPELYLVRPSERRFWSQSQGRIDADSAVIEWLSAQPSQE